MRFPEPTVSVLKALAETQGLEDAATMREAVIWHASSEGLAQSPDKLGIYVQGRIWKRRVPLSQRSHRNLKISFSVRDGAAWDAIMFVAQGEKWSISAAIVIQMLRRAKSLGFDIDVERECERLLMCEFEVIRAKKSIYALAEPGGIDVSVPSDLAYEGIMFVASQMNMPVGPAIAEVMREVATNLGWSSEDIPVRSLHSVT